MYDLFTTFPQSLEHVARVNPRTVQIIKHKLVDDVEQADLASLALGNFDRFVQPAKGCVAAVDGNQNFAVHASLLKLKFITVPFSIHWEDLTRGISAARCGIRVSVRT